jgi:PAS domain S-box-containing protein
MQGQFSQPGSDPSPRTTVVRYAGAILTVAVAVFVAASLESLLDPTVVFLIAVVIAAWFSGLWPALLASLLSTVALDFYFTAPFFQFTGGFHSLARIAAFTAVAALFASTSARRRSAERALKEARDHLDAKVRERTAELEAAHARVLAQAEALREQAELLDLTHDTIFVRDTRDVIRYWNRGAEELYGWTPAEANGRMTHDLMRTVLPASLEEITAHVVREGRWEGELVHTKRDGSQVVVASRWSLLRDSAGQPIGILETNNDITARKRAEHELEELAGRLIHAQEEERSRIGRELHDHISQMLGVLTIRIDQLRIDPATPASLAGALEELRQSTAEITTDIHSLSHRLHSSALDYLGLVPALQRLVTEFSARHGIAIELTHNSVPASLKGDVGLCLFRVAEESLTNIAKHSRARTARVHVRGAPDGLHLTVEDSGNGFDVDSLERRGGLGFVSMRERLRAVRGTFHVDSAPSRGTRVEVTVPAASLPGDGRTDLAANESGRAASDALSSA